MRTVQFYGAFFKALLFLSKTAVYTKQKRRQYFHTLSLPSIICFVSNASTSIYSEIKEESVQTRVPAFRNPPTEQNLVAHLWLWRSLQLLHLTPSSLLCTLKGSRFLVLASPPTAAAARSVETHDRGPAESGDDITQVFVRGGAGVAIDGHYGVVHAHAALCCRPTVGH